MIQSNFISVPIWENGSWSTIDFPQRQDFIDFLKPLFKEPGKYNFDETTYEWNVEAHKFQTKGYFCDYKEGSLDYRRYWDDQKLKCRRGVIFKTDKETWYLPREYYMWINFLPIYNKVEKKINFPYIWDTQYHMALYELLAELHYKHAAIFKKRQIASSYYHAAKMINLVWFEQGPVCKMGSSLKDKINDKGTWKYLTEYKSFLDSKTAWYRPMNPSKVLMWQQQIEETINGRPELIGLKGSITGLTLEKDPTSGVGGACSIFFYEEAGIAPTMNLTKEYLLPALKMGEITTGIFIAAGSVGELDKCEPLKDLIYNPDINDIYAVETDLIDEKGTIGKTGLFIPEQWSRLPYIDEFGNSLVEKALESIQTIRAREKKELGPEEYQLRVSQEPTNIKEGFAHRKESKFPQILVTAQKRRILEKDYPLEFLDITRDGVGKILLSTTSKYPITQFPITRTTEDKTGVLVVWERPDQDARWGTYYGSVDPVSEGKSTTSESLCSIYIYKNPVAVTRHDGNKLENFIEGDKIVAAWCGRFDDINKTHERLELIIEWYNAWTIVENNVSLFIQHMINKKKQKYLVPKNQVLFLKELGSNNSVFQDYGWKNTGVLFKNHLLSYLIEYLKEEIHYDTKTDGTIVRTTYGIERIPDIMAMVEMEAYEDGLNVDRLVALAALISFAKVQQANRSIIERYESTDKKHLQKSENLFKLGTVSPFKNLGKSGGNNNNRPNRSAYKNLK